MLPEAARFSVLVDFWGHGDVKRTLTCGALLLALSVPLQRCDRPQSPPSPQSLPGRMDRLILRVAGAIKIVTVKESRELGPLGERNNKRTVTFLGAEVKSLTNHAPDPFRRDLVLIVVAEAVETCQGNGFDGESIASR